MNTTAYDNHINGRPTPKTTLRGLEAALSKAKVLSTEATPTHKPDETARVSSNNPKQSNPLTMIGGGIWQQSELIFEYSIVLKCYRVESLLCR